MKSSIKDIIVKVLLAPVILIVVIVVAPFYLLYFALRFLNGLWLSYQFRSRWGPEGKHILFIYSESPNWQEYIEGNIVPSIEKKAVFLNWSKRSDGGGTKPLEVKVLLHWGGDSEFNPMAIIFTSKWKVKIIRFYKAFKDFKHGKDKLLKEKESELYGYL